MAVLLECLQKQHQEEEQEDGLCSPSPSACCCPPYLGCDHTSDACIIKHISACEALVELVPQQGKLGQLAERDASSISAGHRPWPRMPRACTVVMLDDLQYAMQYDPDGVMQDHQARTVVKAVLSAAVPPGHRHHLAPLSHSGAGPAAAGGGAAAGAAGCKPHRPLPHISNQSCTACQQAAVQLTGAGRRPLTSSGATTASVMTHARCWAQASEGSG